MKLTKKSIQNLTFPPEAEGKTQALFFDDQLKGFGVRVTPTGKKTYFQNYILGGVTKRKTIGNFPEMPLDEARETGMALKNMGRKGIDPKEKEREAKAKSYTLGDLANDYFEQWVEKRNGAATQKKYRSYLDRFVLDRFGRTAVNSIDRQLCKQILAPCEEHETTFNRVRTMLCTMFNWGIDEEKITINFASTIKPKKLQSRSEWIKPDELGRLIHSIEGYSNRYVRGYFLLLMFTAARRTEVQEKMRWENLNLVDRIWTIPETKNSTNHEVFLSEPALEIINDLDPKEKGFVIQGQSPGTFYNGLDKAWGRICSKAKVSGYTIHDIRRTMASYLAQDGMPRDRIAQILNHKDRSTTGIYARLTFEDKKTTFTRLAELIQERTGSENI